MPENEELHVELVEKELITTNIVEKELIEINLNTIDILPQVSSPGADLDDLIYDETPTLVTGQKYQTANNFVTGSLRIYINGIREKNFTIEGNDKFILDLPWTPDISDDIKVDYTKT